MLIAEAQIPLMLAAAVTGAHMDRRVERPPPSRWRRFAVAAALIALALLAWRLTPSTGSTDIAVGDVDIGGVSRAPFADYLPVRANVAPAVTTLVGALSGGQVETVLAQDGSMVVARQPIATLANPTLKLDVLTREATIASQLGTVSGDDLQLERGRLDRATQTASAEYDYIKAKRDLSVQQRLHDQGFVSDAGVESYIEQARYHRKRLGQLQSGETSERRISGTQTQRLADTRARLSGNLAAVQASLDALVIRTPVGGRLTNFTIQPGQMLKAGDPAGQVDSEGSWKLVADVDEYYLGRVRVGQTVGGNEAQLVVSKVLPAVTNGHFRIELTFRGPPPAGLNRGQAIDVRVTLGATRKAMVAPIGGWLESGGGAFAFVVDADGLHARRRAVTVGRRSPEQIEILSGLSVGDRIVTSSTASIKGDILNIR
ncbi:HlyD family efflux transporter periplasmic adaptor subunit [Sphingomonas sp. PP-CC-3A-396]|uniref:efflux RND transporter periplasmic adaptor subunit n=1 Tax=Sphingomonas sp. PP-CC-3A-396 TaxID=2135655 RepID=UPI0010F3395B|nr:HlyD family efflux transporter periplasmic adaptor subunit [Sphingomonas sp. PP-CC-3A-396]TCQ06527.1 HlyD family secretion protein [Sphingomonas sp. PP-CC-3A-396]